MKVSNCIVLKVSYILAFCLLISVSNISAQLLVADINQEKGSEIPKHLVSNDEVLVFSTEFGRIYKSTGQEDGAELIFDLSDYNYGQWFPKITLIDSLLYFTPTRQDSCFWLALNVNTKELKNLMSLPGAYSFYRDDFTKVNDDVFFGASCYASEQLLVRYNQKTSISEVVKNFNFDGVPFRFTPFLDKMLFVLTGGSEMQVWISDGSSEGTVKLYSVPQEGNFSFEFSRDKIPQFLVYQEEFFFIAPSDGYGYEMYRSDGTEEGTTLLLDYNPGPKSGIFSFSLLEDKLLLSTRDSNDIADLVTYEIATGQLETFTHQFNGLRKGDIYQIVTTPELTYIYMKTDEEGLELWRSDGSADGTFLLKDIYAGSGSALEQRFRYQAAGNSLYFVANDGINGEELWFSDGTTEGTQLVKDVYPGADGSEIEQMILFADKLYFIGESLEDGFNIFASSGSAESTMNSGLSTTSKGGSSYPVLFVEVDDKLVFSATTNCTGRELFSTGGSAESTTILKHLKEGKAGQGIPQPILIKDNLYLTARDSDNNTGIYRTNGTVDQTDLFISPAMLQDLDLGYPSSPGGISDAVLFTSVKSDSSYALYKVDNSTNLGIELVKDLETSAYPFSGSFYQLTDDMTIWIDSPRYDYNQVWKTDGTEAGTSLIKEFQGNTIYNGSIINEVLYFLNRGELWRSDGTEDGTYILNIDQEEILSFTSATTEIFFASKDRVYRSDGTQYGTVFLAERTSQNDYYLNYMRYIDGNLVFTHGTSERKSALVFYSLSENTWEHLDFGQTVQGGLGFEHAIDFEDRLYFRENDDVHGRELWSTDGTKTGTHMVKDIYTGQGGSSPLSFYVFQDFLYFGANGGDGSGHELYKYSPYDKDNDGYLPEDDEDDNNPLVNVPNPNNPKDVTIECAFVSAIDEIDNNYQEIKIYPNPASYQLNIELAPGEKHEIYVHDLTGKRIAHLSNQVDYISIDLSSFQSGYYILNVNSLDSAAKYVSRFIVVK